MGAAVIITALCSLGADGSAKHNRHLAIQLRDGSSTHGGIYPKMQRASFEQVEITCT